ncbi:MAG: hypothetical protein KJ694_22145 [Gammaproteobacteria bacterium]|nr:hypothetical protein [Gammaproteobacteria bacterium]
MSEFEQFSKMIGGLAIAYPKFELTAPTIKAYWRILRDIPIDVLDSAMLQIASESKWFPTAAEIRAAAFGLLEQATGLPSAYDGWAEVCRAFGSVGRYRAPEWSSPIIGGAVDAIGGWAALCDSENTMADRARFVDAYNILLERERKSARMLPEVRRVVAALGAGRNATGEALVGEFFARLPERTGEDEN